MCGIYCSISSRGSPSVCSSVVRELLKARGPDCGQELSLSWKIWDSASSANREVKIEAFGTVLALRGDAIEPQPVRSRHRCQQSTSRFHSESFLCWNGEAWKQDGQVIAGSDSRYVFELLDRACSSTNLGDKDKRILDALTSIAGPFAFVFYDAESSRFLYGTDRLGRRSLLFRRHTDLSGVDLCSIIDGIPKNHGWEEVGHGGVEVFNVLKPTVPEYWEWPIKYLQVNPQLPQGQIHPLTVSSPIILQLDQHLRDSILLRIADIPSLGQGPDKIQQQPQKDARIAVLFSGGLDCSILARLAHDHLPPDQPIDLLNVAFENPRTLAVVDGSISVYECCPDRITGRSAHAELLRVCPGRNWRFIAIDIPYCESEKHCNIILILMAPLKTEMDLSIAKALYFAARGQGQATDSSPSSSQQQEQYSYSTRARVLLSGLGADELFAGYTRHSTAFARGGYGRLAEELDLDFQRLGNRNLGRDDRIISHWGREIRYPYLDEDFVSWTLALPVWEKCGFRFLPKGVNGSGEQSEAKGVESHSMDPAKQALRLLARRLGLDHAAAAKKRAIQFGARTAKMHIGSSRSKGTDDVY
jgi:asparagine synthetase B (glutamine-hydrolysing)